MAFFDKLKEKVNKVLDVEKLSETANKAIASIKGEVAKTVDPSIREQERLEKEKALQEQKEQTINDFLSSIAVDRELDYIFTVLEKSGATVINFEKGVEHLVSKTEATITSGDILPALKKELFIRAFTGTQSAVAKAVAVDYFVRNIIDDQMLSLYMRFAISREKGSVSYGFMEVPFVQALYSVAAHAVNYWNNGMKQEDYQTITPGDFAAIIEDSDVLKSYTDADPFTADDVRNQWAQELCHSATKIVRSSRLSSSLCGVLEDESYVDALYYLAYVALHRNQEESAENVSVAGVASTYMDYLKEYYNKIRR